MFEAMYLDKFGIQPAPGKKAFIYVDIAYDYKVRFVRGDDK